MRAAGALCQRRVNTGKHRNTSPRHKARLEGPKHQAPMPCKFPLRKCDRVKVPDITRVTNTASQKRQSAERLRGQAQVGNMKSLPRRAAGLFVWIMKKWVALPVIRTVLISSKGTTPTVYLVGMLLFIMKAKSDSLSKEKR